jgi:hypothetical protein
MDPKATKVMNRLVGNKEFAALHFYEGKPKTNNNEMTLLSSTGFTTYTFTFSNLRVTLTLEPLTNEEIWVTATPEEK